MGRKLKIAGLCVVAAGVAIYLANTSRFAPTPSGRTELLAHRGVHQTFSVEGVENDTCTAQSINPPAHAFIENTLASMQAAFDAGADVVEFDIHPTTDGQFAVFHDWTLDCRTDGKGVTREKSLAELKALDVGYGYTADGGATFPLRGKGVGLLPSLDDVLAAFPGRRFLIHVKSRDPAEGRLLAVRLSHLQPEQRARLMVYGADEPLAEVKIALPDLRMASRGNLMNCLARYIALGWSGHVPEACRHGAMFVPDNIAPWLWGWPNRLASRLEASDTKLVVLGPYSGGDFSSGVDGEQQLRALSVNVPGTIWTNRIETIGPLVRK